MPMPLQNRAIIVIVVIFIVVVVVVVSLRACRKSYI
jgi:hypothetical protein